MKAKYRAAAIAAACIVIPFGALADMGRLGGVAADGNLSSPGQARRSVKGEAACLDAARLLRDAGLAEGVRADLSSRYRRRCLR